MDIQIHGLDKQATTRCQRWHYKSKSMPRVDRRLPPWADEPGTSGPPVELRLSKTDAAAPLEASHRREELVNSKCDELERQLAQRDAQLADHKSVVEELRSALARASQSQEAVVEQLRREIREGFASEKLGTLDERRRWTRERAGLQARIGALEAQVQDLERKLVNREAEAADERRKHEAAAVEASRRARATQGRLRAALQRALDEKDREIRAVRADAEADVVRLRDARDAALAAHAATNPRRSPDGQRRHEAFVLNKVARRFADGSPSRPRRPPPPPPPSRRRPPFDADALRRFEGRPHFLDHADKLPSQLLVALSDLSITPLT